MACWQSSLLRLEHPRRSRARSPLLTTRLGPELTIVCLRSSLSHDSRTSSKTRARSNTSTCGKRRACLLCVPPPPDAERLPTKSALEINARLVFTIIHSRVQITAWKTSRSGALHSVRRESGMRYDLGSSYSQLCSSAVRRDS